VIGLIVLLAVGGIIIGALLVVIILAMRD